MLLRGLFQSLVVIMLTKMLPNMVMWYKNVDAIWLEELNLSVCVLPFGVFRKMEGQLESSFSRTKL